MFKIFMFALCLAYVAAADQMCKSDSECGSDECCLHPLFHKRFLFDFDSVHTTGMCYPRGQEKEFCEPPMVHDPFNPNLHEWHCPCMSGLECHGEKEHHGNGMHTYSNPRCRATTMLTTMMPSTMMPSTMMPSTMMPTTMMPATMTNTNGGTQTPMQPIMT
ncbi:toxin CSTX-20-like [Haliotis cracherodii]|uniref:toxin CSTX-20-like n=1 Tax=Haliotis cracherodii TaxID=6455 RepID=UPI0039EBAF61